jgi:hypothetical protein
MNAQGVATKSTSSAAPGWSRAGMSNRIREQFRVIDTSIFTDHAEGIVWYHPAISTTI